MGCSPELKKRLDKMLELHDMWFDRDAEIGKNIHAVTGSNPKWWKRFYEAEVRSDFDYGDVPALRDLKRLERKIKKFSRQMNKTPGKFAKWFYLPQNVMAGNPATKELFEKMIRSGNFYRGNMDTVTSNLDRIVSLLDMSEKETGLMKRLGIGRNNSQKELAKRHAEYKRLQTVNPDKALRYYKDNLENLSNEGYLANVQNLHEIMTNPNIVTSSNRDKAVKKYGTNLVQAADLWHNTMAPRLWKVLNSGIHDYIKILESGQTALSIEKRTIDAIKENLLEKNEKTGKWEMKREENYFPTQILDILPTFNALTESIWSGELGKKLDGDVHKYVDSITKEIATNLKKPGSIFERNKKRPERISKDVVTIIDTYAKGATRFNYTARVTRDTVEALRALHEMEGKDMDDHVKFLADYVRDTHSAAVGLDMKQSKLAKISRAITSWQFMSKLGLNLRGAARNATQSLQNYVYFGWKGIREYQKFAQGDMKDLMNKALNEHGLYFTNLEELAITPDMLPNTKMVDGRLVESTVGFAENFTHTLEKVAKVTGKPMQWVENHVNRQLTFKIAFSKMYNELSARPDIVKRKLSGAKPGTGKILEKQISDKIYADASNYAAAMVKELHFEYSPFAKPKALRTPVGSVLGQFSTFGINFFEYQRKILAEGGGSVLSRDWGSESAWRMYRLGLTYVAIDALISPLFSTDIGNLVQNDTKERVSQLYTWFTGTEAEKKRVFFGKGPLLSTFGGPFVSDLITTGQLTNFMNMREADWLTYLAGYQDFAERTKDQKVMEFTRVLNTQIARTIHSTLPKMVNGTGLMTLAGHELGLYGSSNLKRQHNELFKNVRKISPTSMNDRLTPLDEKNRIAKGYQRAMKGKLPDRRSVSPEDMQQILASLAILQNKD